MSSSDLSDYEGANTRSSPKRIAEVVSKFCALKRKLVTDICFQGMLKVPAIKNLDRKFTLSLLNKIDIKKSAIRVNEHTYIELSADDVYQYLEIPKGPNKLFGLDDRSESEKMDFIRFGIGSSAFDIDEKNSLKAAEDFITAEYPDGMSESQSEQFKVSFVCFVMGNFLLAKYSYNHGIKDFWGSLLKPNEIPSYNFCQAVVDEILESARHVQRETKAKRHVKNISGCHLFLQAKFLDSMNLGMSNIPKSGIPRIEAFTLEIIKRMIINFSATSNSSDGYETPTTGAKKPPKGNSTLQIKTPVSKANSTPIVMPNQEYSAHKPPSTAYLAAYTSGAVERRLNDKQINDLKIHNARMKLFINNFKTKVFLDLQGVFLDNPSSKDFFTTNADQLMKQVLEQVLVLSKSLHEHTAVSKETTIPSPAFYTSSKRTADNPICGYESSTDCPSVKRNRKDNLLSGINLLPQLTNVAGTSSTALHTEENLQTGYTTPKDQMIKQKQMLICSPQSICGLEDLRLSSFIVHNPTPPPSKIIAASPSSSTVITPASNTRVQLDIDTSDKNLNAQDGIDLNETPPNDYFVETQIMKIRVNKGRMARNPWFYRVARKDVDKELAEKLFNWLGTTVSHVLDSYWVNHPTPKTIIIAGNDFKSVFTRGYNFTNDLLDLAIRRYFQMDRSMYGEGVRLRWMHPFESDFARKVLNGEDVLKSRSVRLQLTGTSEDYDISNCRMIVVPSIADNTWSSYFWDMKESIVHVVDPTFDTCKASEFHDLHSPIVDKLQEALSTLLADVYDGWEIDWTIWRKNYIQPFLVGKKSNESGMLTLLALRHFSGKKFELPQTEESLSTFSKELLYSLLSIKGNRGVVPDVFIQSID